MYEYDTYNRTTAIRRHYWNGSADVENAVWKTVFAYDSAPNGWGRLGSISTYQHFGDASGATPIVESFEYTVAGLVSKKTLNVTGASAVSVSYEWDNEGRPIAQKFPDMATGNPTLDTGPRFTWGYDSMGRLATMGQTEPWGGFAATLVSSTTYNAAGQMTQLVRPGDSETRTYNTLGQLVHQLGLGKNIEYRYSVTANDGRITHRKDWVSGEEVAYQYDALGRLASAVTTGPEWGLSFTYDGFGNKTQQTVTKGTGPSHSFAVSAATNRLTAFGHDANGNVTSGLAGLPGTYSYDGENRMVDNGVETYGYGAGNRRLWKKSTVSGSWAEVYLYGLGGEVLEVFRGMMGSALERQSVTPTQRAWFGGRLIEKKGTAMNADRLGSYEKAYPYGELAGAVGTSGEKFATYWRDAGTGLDYAVNRYYSSQMGRFLTADPYQASGGPANPGSWNRYAYVEGDPVNYHDPGGLDRSDGQGPTLTWNPTWLKFRPPGVDPAFSGYSVGPSPASAERPDPTREAAGIGTNPSRDATKLLVDAINAALTAL
ncbi:MAG: RHS repeat-associated core domain-containing protein, partial [Desulfobacterales bacterium]|nr:RHS repeat-associated core domain-containing protein [Desulfobacterales bacterium]